MANRAISARRADRRPALREASSDAAVSCDLAYTRRKSCSAHGPKDGLCKEGESPCQSMGLLGREGVCGQRPLDVLGQAIDPPICGRHGDALCRELERHALQHVAGLGRLGLCLLGPEALKFEELREGRERGVGTLCVVDGVEVVHIVAATTSAAAPPRPA